MAIFKYVMKDSENQYNNAARRRKHNLQNSKPLLAFMLHFLVSFLLPLLPPYVKMRLYEQEV
jgi:hypothetical protein